MGGGPKGTYVALVLLACASGGLYGLVQSARDASLVELEPREVVRVRGGQPVLVLVEKGGARLLGVPLTGSGAVLIEKRLRRDESPGLAAESLRALGGQVLRGCIDGVSGEWSFRGHLVLGSGAGELRVEAGAGEALALAIEAGAPVFVEPEVLEAAGISRDELRAARSVKRDPGPAPVQGM